MNPASWPPLAAGRELTQPKAQFIAQLCITYLIWSGSWLVIMVAADLT